MLKSSLCLCVSYSVGILVFTQVYIMSSVLTRYAVLILFRIVTFTHCKKLRRLEIRESVRVPVINQVLRINVSSI